MIKLDNNLFSGTLNEETINYINEKRENNAKNKELDLRDLCEEVLL